MPKQAVLFDLGSTLWHIPERPPTDTIRKETVRRIFGLLHTWGVEPEGELRFLGRDIRLTIGAADSKAYESDQVSPHYPSVVREVVASKGLEISDEQAEELWKAWNLPGAFFGRRLFEGTAEMLETLRERGYRLGMVTNRPFAGAAFHDEVKELGLDEYFDVMSISCDVGYMKPHPEIFHHALKALDVAPENAIMVGDSLIADVQAAQRLGMIAIWRRYRDLDEKADGIKPDFEVSELSELPGLPCFPPQAPDGA